MNAAVAVVTTPASAEAPSADVVTVTTRNLQLAAFFLSRGMPFVAARRLPGRQHFSAVFVLADPHGQAAALESKFFADQQLRRFVAARRALGRALEVARDQGHCAPSDIGDALARFGGPEP